MTTHFNLLHLRKLLLALAVLVAGAAGAFAQSEKVNSQDYADLLRKVEKMPPASKQALAEIGSNPRRLAAFLNNSTVLSYSRSYGTQIEYLGPYGTTVLWFPGNTALLFGRWKTQAGHGDGKWPEICFKYPLNSFDPVTKAKGGHWECNEGIAYLVHADEISSGDVMNLDLEKLPFVLKKSKTTLDAAMKTAGIPGHAENKKTW